MDVVAKFGPFLPVVGLAWIPFAVATVVLKVVLIDPLYAWLEGRDHATVGARAEAAKLVANSASRTSELEARVAAARAAAEALRAKHVAAGQTVERQLVAEARAAADARLAAAVAQVRDEAAAARASIPAAASAISSEIVGRLLGRQA